MSSDWYARRLAQIQGQQPPPPAAVEPPRHAAPQQPLLPGQLPPHLAPYATPPAQQAAPQTPGAFVGPQPGNVPQQFYSYNAAGAQVPDDGHVALLYNSAAQTGGSKVVRENSNVCPNCNNPTYFTIQEGGVFSKAVGGQVKAMQCSTCNYPKVQAGSHGGSLGSARSAGPAKQARQLPANHRVTVAVEGGGYATFDPPTGG